MNISKEKGDFGAIGTGVEDSDVFAITLTGNVTVGEYLTFIPEIRLDSASDDAFINNDLEASKSLSSFLVGCCICVLDIKNSLVCFV